MFTVVESPLFQKLWPLYGSEQERGEFAAFIAADPTAGAVVAASKLKEIRRALEDQAP